MPSPAFPLALMLGGSGSRSDIMPVYTAPETASFKKKSRVEFLLFPHKWRAFNPSRLKITPPGAAHTAYGRKACMRCRKRHPPNTTPPCARRSSTILHHAALHGTLQHQCSIASMVLFLTQFSIPDCRELASDSHAPLGPPAARCAALLQRTELPDLLFAEHCAHHTCQLFLQPVAQRDI